MKPIAILYATREGQAQKVAEQAASEVRAHGVDVAVFSVRGLQGIDLRSYAAAVLAASVHAGQHEAEMIDFVKRHREELKSLPTAFLSLTLSEAGAERENATAEEHQKFAADVQRMIDRFVAATAWKPEHVVPVAGALRYSRYNFLVRMLMKHIARQSGGSTDTSRDHEYTDWTALHDFIRCFVEEVKGRVSTSTDTQP